MCLETKPGGSSPTRFLFWMNVGFPPAPNCQPPFQAMKMFLYEELGVKKTTSSWQKVHPKQENIPENKALLGGGHVTGGRLTGWPAMIYILQPPTLPSSQKKNVLRRIENGPAPKKKDFALLDDAWQVTCFGDGLVIQTEQLLLLLRSVRWLFSGSGVMGDRGPPDQKNTAGKLQAW